MLNRRDVLGLGVSAAATALAAAPAQSKSDDSRRFRVIDTNISLFQWPFRRLPLDEVAALVSKLRSLGISQAWAGSFEGLLQRDLAEVNRRLAEACRKRPELIAIGSVNLDLPAWEDDLRRCIEEHDMHGIRLHPNYHGYTLADPRFTRLLERAAKAGRFVQIAAAMEDARTQHPMLRAADVDLTPLAERMPDVAGARVQILNYRPRPPLLETLAKTPGLFFDTARVEGTDGVPDLIKRVPAGRVMFGTHAPFLIPEAALIRVHESGQLNEAALRAALSENADRLLGNHRRPGPGTSQLGLPPAQQLKTYRIWDSYFTPSHSHPGRDGSSRLVADIERSLPAIDKGKFERLCYFAHVGIGTTADSEYEQLARSRPDVVLQPLQRWPDLLLGMIQLNANDVRASLAAVNRWLRDGPMLGVYFPGSGPGALSCAHRNFNPLVERITELNGVIMQHTWFKTGGKQGSGESTPLELAELAARHPQQKFLCAHAGGEWQRGIRAVRERPNILVETSGFDATAGFIEMAVRELGSERIVFGSHLPSRSLGTELGKIVAADISEQDKQRIFGENFRSLVRPILGSKSG